MENDIFDKVFTRENTSNEYANRICFAKVLPNALPAQVIDFFLFFRKWNALKYGLISS